MGVQRDDKLVAERIGIAGRISVGEILELHENTIDNHDDISLNSNNNQKQVLKNNGSGIYSNDTLESNDLDDHNTEGVLPEVGWVIKFDGTNFIPCLRKVLKISNTQITNVNDSNTPLPLRFEEDINIQRTGWYSFDLKSGASSNNTTYDIVGILSFNNTKLAQVINNEVFRVESKDSAGNNNDGRGTDQVLNIGNKLFYNATSVGIFKVKLEFFSSSFFRDGRGNVSLFDTSLVVEEELGLIEI